jgi:hypothetical protein
MWRRSLEVGLVLSVFIPGIASAATRADPGLGELTKAELDLRAANDIRLIQSYASGVERILGELEAAAKMWNKPKDQALSAEERVSALALFEQVLAHGVALDGMAHFHLEFWRIAAMKDPARHARHFALGFAAYCLKARLGLTFVSLTQNKPQFETLLDEGSREVGLPPGLYGRLKLNVVHVETVSKILAAHSYHLVLKQTSYAKIPVDSGFPRVLQILDRAYAQVESHLQSRGVQLFAGNAFDILQDRGRDNWFPVQAGVAEWMGDAKVKRLDKMLISLAQVKDAEGRSEPGDILVERRNWYLSNIALPGFWPHSALWLGTPVELSTYFDTEPEVTKAYGGTFTGALARRFPTAWKTYLGNAADGFPHRLIEAISEGVSFSAAEESIRADYVGMMRPKLPKLEKARAIERAFSYAFRPYDFDFDFNSDATLVCTELVYKAYEPRQGMKGLKLDLDRVAGRTTLGPNSIIRQFDRDYGTPQQQLDFVWFLDGHEKEGTASFADLTTFRASHARVKWDIAQE